VTVVVGFELGGWDATVVFEEASVVEPVDPFEGGEFEVVEAAPRSFVADKLGFVEPVHRFGERVVVAVAARTNAVDDTVRGEAFGVTDREILHAPVAVMHEGTVALAPRGAARAAAHGGIGDVSSAD
jgi:hypothetical protein